ncbi:MAG: RtcB family protein [Candidatus Micrarchaeota archaeon]
MDFKEKRKGVFEAASESGVPVRVYAKKELLKQMEKDRTLSQASNVASLPGIIDAAMIMPDGHEGYGFPIGGVAAFSLENGVVSPGGVGYDINCGMRLARTNLTVEDVKPKLKPLIESLFDNIPCGIGTKSRLRLDDNGLRKAVEGGAKWAVENGFGIKEDVEHCEENGRMQNADYSKVSDKAKSRGRPQIGTLGSGNHFIEVQRVEKIFDEETAKAFGITGENQVMLMIHSGSRGFGHQICSDYIDVMLNAARKYGIPLKDPELCCAPLGTKEADDYFGAMNCAVNYAFANRLAMLHWARESFQKVLGGSWEDYEINSVYDVAHNIAKIEEHNGERVCVHRKGATRAFWKGRSEVPSAYREVGQPVIIPGTMNTSSYVLCGLEGAKETFGSTCHGAGRAMSRHEALRTYRGIDVQKEMEAKGMAVRATQPRVLAEEASGAYKNVDTVVESVELTGLCKIVAKLKPLGVIKG